MNYATTSSEYRAWVGMKTRCFNSNHRAYHRYGGRGIKVCDEWIRSFRSFLDHIGPKPSPKHSVDRINNDGDYEPGNVRWATAKEQMNNTCRGPAKPKPPKGDRPGPKKKDYLCGMCWTPLSAREWQKHPTVCPNVDNWLPDPREPKPEEEPK